MQDVDVVVAGAGPAGLALAAELVARDLTVAVVAPRPHEPWPETHCGWLDELAAAPGFDPGRSVRRVYDPVTYVDGTGAATRLPRAYALLDPVGAPAVLRERLDLHDDAVRTWGQDGERVVALGRSGARWRAHLLVDATGAPAAVAGPRRPATLWQWAYGLVARLDPAPVEPGGAVLMDFSGAHRDVPSFRYVLDLGDGTHLVEETVLAGPRRSGLMGLLEVRLRERLGASLREEVAVERVVIPIDAGRPAVRGPVVAVGAAAGLVHPASGYSVTGSYAVAPEVADAVRDGLDRGLTGVRLARRVDAAVWPRPRRLAQATLARGLRAVLDDDPGDFFGRFFALPQPVWEGYLRQPPDAPGVLTAMTRLWAGLPPRDGARLVRDFAAARRG